MSDRWRVGDLIERRYRIAALRRGGMGIVFLCFDQDSQVPVAIKTFQDRFLLDEASIDRFIAEAEIWVHLGQHRNIVTAYTVLRIGNRPYILLEYVPSAAQDGSDLASLIARSKLDDVKASSIAIQVCLGLEHAEARFRETGKVFAHRDVKPTNILITPDGTVKVTDFGLATAAVADESGLKQGVAGTPPYMSPEQWRGEACDSRSDIYSLGCVLYELVTGRPAFRYRSLDLYRQHHIAVMPPRPSEVVAGASPTLDAVIMRCLQKNPGSR